MFDLNEIDEKIALAQKEVNILKLRRKEIVEMSDDKRMAEHLHSLICSLNHDDACSWQYEQTNKCFDAHGEEITYIAYRKSNDPGVTKETHVEWEASSHSKYLKMAQEMLKVSDYETIIKIIKISKDR